MGFLDKLFKGPQVDMEKSNANRLKMRQIFNQVIDNGDDYQVLYGDTEDVGRFNYGFVHGSKTKVGNLIVGWNEATLCIVTIPTAPDLSAYGEATFYRRENIHKAYINKYPNNSFIIYPDKKGYLDFRTEDWLEDEKLYVYVSQEDDVKEFTDFFTHRFAKKG